MTATADLRAAVPRRFGGCALLLCLLALSAAGMASDAAAYFVPGDPKAGMKVFFSKGCAQCHSVLGEGGRSAPDVARAPGDHMSADELLAAMWNHAPTMWERMNATKIAPPRFTEAEMQDLFAFLYSVRSLDQPGNADRGRQLLAEKHCLRCHAVGGRGGRAGPDLERWTQYRNPVSWIQTMWNHGPGMQATMSARGIEWPMFRGSDIADLVAYVRQAAPASRKKVYLRPSDPAAGKAVFRAKGCASCHGLHGSGARKGAPDLASNSLPRTLGQFAADMWNHGPVMWSSMERAQVRNRMFSNAEMADLIAYLFAERYFESHGDRVQGRAVFDGKGCAACHEAGGTGPDLAGWANASPPVLATGLWNHGPAMLERMQRESLEWPAFERGEMADLLAFLRQPAGRGGKGR